MDNEELGWKVKVLIVVFSILGSAFGVWIRREKVKKPSDKIAEFFLGAIIAAVATPVVMSLWRSDFYFVGFISFTLGIVGASLCMELVKSVPEIMRHLIDFFKGLLPRLAGKGDAAKAKKENEKVELSKHESNDQ